jgi:hypothetical protein
MFMSEPQAGSMSVAARGAPIDARVKLDQIRMY